MFATSDRGWQTRIASFKFPNCGKPWVASYGVSNTPATWTTKQTQSYTITLTNNGTQNWPATGPNPVHLGVHFGTRGGGTASSYPWLTDQRINLPADLAAGASVTFTVTVTAPSRAGNLVLEYQMVKEAQ